MTVRWAKKGDTNYGATDRFTWAHLGVGFGLAAAGLTVEKAVLVSVIWETMEVPLKRQFPKSFPKASLDSPANKVGDILAVAAGCFAARRFLGAGDD